VNPTIDNIRALAERLQDEAWDDGKYYGGFGSSGRTVAAFDALLTAIEQALAQAEPLTDEQIQDLLKKGNPTDEEMRLVRLGYSAQPYDQTALELCESCGWKTLIPGEGCLNCERQPQPDDTALIRQALVYLERSVDNYPTGQALSRSCHEDTIAALRERLK
jgi:hypothetical protein